MNNSESKSTLALVCCDKGGNHQGENIISVCLNPLCREDCLCCAVCLATKHVNHSIFSLRTLFDDLEYKTRKLERKSELVVMNEIENALAGSSQALKSLWKYFEAKFTKMEIKMTQFYLNVKKETSAHFRSRAVWTSEIERVRFENDKNRLQDKMIDILNNVTLGEGKVQKINEDFFGSTSTEPIEAFTQSFLETLKNMHSAVSYQYAKMYNPLVQPQHLIKDYFGNDNQSNQYINNNVPENGSLSNQSNHRASSSSRIQQASQQQLSSLYSQQQSQQKLQSYVQSPQILSSQSSQQVSWKDQEDQVLSSAKQTQRGQAFSVENGNFKQNPISLMTSTVSQSIPNLSQLQQTQIELQKQIAQQQQLLQQLQIQSVQSQPSQNQKVQPQSGSSKYPFFNSEEAKNNLSRMHSPSPPTRLMYYSSLFQAHLQAKQNPFGTLSTQKSALKVSQHTSYDNATSSQFQQNNSFGATQNNSNNSNKNQNYDDYEQQPNFGLLAKNYNNNRNNNNSYAFSQEQDINTSDFENKRQKDVPKSSERQVRFMFSKDLKHSTIECEENMRRISGACDTKESRLALVIPSVETKPLMEFQWGFKIINCNSLAYSSPLAIGLCLKKSSELSQFKFLGDDNASNSSSLSRASTFSRISLRNATSISGMKDLNTSTASSKFESNNHGCYLLTSTGFIRNYTDPNQDMKRVQVRFNKGDLLTCHFNPFRKYLKIKNTTSGEFCMINIELSVGDALYPCVRLSYSQDLVEIQDLQE